MKTEEKERHSVPFNNLMRFVIASIAKATIPGYLIRSSHYVGQNVNLSSHQGNRFTAALLPQFLKKFFLPAGAQQNCTNVTVVIT